MLRDIFGRDVLTILNTRRPVNIVFTARDTEKESMPIGVNRGGRFSALCGPSSVNEPHHCHGVTCYEHVVFDP